jgi:hypothetical protein
LTGARPQVLGSKLRYAIAHCKAIDTDFAARGPAAAGGLADPLADDADADAEDQPPAAAGAAWGAAGAGGREPAAVTEFWDEGEWEV